MTDNRSPDDPGLPAVDLTELDPKLQLALRHVANVDECCRTLLQILDAMPVIEGLTTTIPDGQEKRPRIWIHDAIRACERLPGKWQRDVKRAWQLLGDSVNLYNQTVSSMGRYVERVNVSLNGRLTTSAHKWARRFLDQYAGDLEHVQTLLDGSDTAFDDLETNSLVSIQFSDPLAEEASVFEVMETMEALASIVLGKLADAGHIAPTEPAPLSDGTVLPLKHLLDESDAESETNDTPAPLANSGDGIDHGHTRRSRWRLAALCAAMVLILIACGVMTHQAQIRAEMADERATMAIEEARRLREATMMVRVRRWPGSESEIVRPVRPGHEI